MSVSQLLLLGLKRLCDDLQKHQCKKPRQFDLRPIRIHNPPKSSKPDNLTSG